MKSVQLVTTEAYIMSVHMVEWKTLKSKMNNYRCKHTHYMAHSVRGDSDNDGEEDGEYSARRQVELAFMPHWNKMSGMVFPLNFLQSIRGKHCLYCTQFMASKQGMGSDTNL